MRTLLGASAELPPYFWPHGKVKKKKKRFQPNISVKSQRKLLLTFCSRKKKREKVTRIMRVPLRWSMCGKLWWCNSLAERHALFLWPSMKTSFPPACFETLSEQKRTAATEAPSSVPSLPTRAHVGFSINEPPWWGHSTTRNWIPPRKDAVDEVLWKEIELFEWRTKKKEKTLAKSQNICFFLVKHLQLVGTPWGRVGSCSCYRNKTGWTVLSRLSCWKVCIVFCGRTDWEEKEKVASCFGERGEPV